MRKVLNRRDGKEVLSMFNFTSFLMIECGWFLSIMISPTKMHALMEQII
jgi:hypothetical protein